MILGISASGRVNGITAKAVKKVLEESEQEYKYISLAGKNIRGCIGCLGCARDNICKVKDDWNEIGELMKKADVIVFGGPNYYNMLNALGHATLERTFSFRHMKKFDLEGKLGVVVTVGYNKEENPVEGFIEKMMLSNKMNILSKVKAGGYSQCYTCGPGKDCEVGNVVKDHGYLEKIEKHHLPKDFQEQDEALVEAINAGKAIKLALRK